MSRTAAPDGGKDDADGPLLASNRVVPWASQSGDVDLATSDPWEPAGKGLGKNEKRPSFVRKVKDGLTLSGSLDSVASEDFTSATPGCQTKHVDVSAADIRKNSLGVEAMGPSPLGEDKGGTSWTEGSPMDVAGLPDWKTPLGMLKTAAAPKPPPPKPPPPPPPANGGADEGAPRKKGWLIEPRSRAAWVWDMVIAMLLLFTAGVTPFEVSFLDTALNVLFFINRLVDTCFLADIFVTFCRPYQNQYGEWVVAHWRIARQYAKTWLLLDIVSILPFDSLALGGLGNADLKVVRAVRLIRLAKLLRILRAGRMFRRWESAIPIDYLRLELIKFVVIVIFIAHWLACGWHMVSVLQADSEGRYDDKDWIEQYGWVTHDDPIGPRYLAAIYWSIATLSTLGYGDVVPVSDMERVYVVVCTVVGSSVYAYMIGNVCGILSSLDAKNAKFYETMSQLNTFIAEKRLPQWLKESLRDFFRFRRSHSNIEDYVHLLHHMSPELRAHVSKHVHSRWMSSVGCFRGASSAFMGAVAMRLKSEAMASNERVYFKGDPAEKMYIVERGVVMYGHAIAVRGRTFGEEVLYRQSARRATAGTLTHSVVLSLERSDLVDILKDFPEMRRRMKQYVVRSLFRMAVHQYVQTWKKMHRDGLDGCEDSVDPEMLPMLFAEKLKRRSAADNITLLWATLKVQRAGRRFLLTRRKKRAQAEENRERRHMKATAAMMEHLGMHHKMGPVKEHGATIEVLNRFTPTHLGVMMMGFTMGEADRVVRASAARKDIAMDEELDADLHAPMRRTGSLAHLRRASMVQREEEELLERGEKGEI